VATGKELLTFTGHSNSVNSVAFAPDGRTALSGSDDSTLKLWDVASGKEIRTFTGHSNGGLSVAFSPDGRKTFTFSRQRKVFALSASDKSVMLWDLTGLEPPAARAGR